MLRNMIGVDSRSGWLLGVTLLAACAPAPPWSKLEPGQDGEQTITGAPLALPRARVAPKLDGALDDAAWGEAARLGPFVDPGSGAEARKHPVAALARLTWDDDKLYLGIVVQDHAPTSGFGRDELDPHVWRSASGVELVLQPGDPGDNRDYYEVQVDVNGAVFDTHFEDYHAPVTGTGDERRFGHQEWASHVERAVFRAPGKFYSIEIALPWASLGTARVPIPPHAGDVWRLNLYSFRDGQRRALAWSPLRSLGSFHRSARFGRVRFAE